MFILEFGAAPSAIVIIPEGGEISLFCEYNRPARVDWYKENILVAPSGDNRQLCDCTSTAINTGRLLTFSNFRSENSAGQYGCWAHVQTGFDECNFEVVVAGKRYTWKNSEARQGVKMETQVLSKHYTTASSECCAANF